MDAVVFHQLGTVYQHLLRNVIYGQTLKINTHNNKSLIVCTTKSYVKYNLKLGDKTVIVYTVPIFPNACLMEGNVPLLL